MIALCTGDPAVRKEGDQFVAEFPSGDCFARVAMTRHQLFMLSGGGHRVLVETMTDEREAQSGEVIAYGGRRRRASR